MTHKLLRMQGFTAGKCSLRACRPRLQLIAASAPHRLHHVQEKLEQRYSKAGLSGHSWSNSAVRRAPATPGGPVSPSRLTRSTSENLESERVRCEAYGQRALSCMPSFEKQCNRTSTLTLLQYNMLAHNNFSVSRHDSGHRGQRCRCNHRARA